MIQPPVWALAALSTLLVSNTQIALADDEPAIVIVSPDAMRTYSIGPKEIGKTTREEGKKPKEASVNAKGEGTTDGVTAKTSETKPTADVAETKNRLPVPPMSERERERAEQCLALNIYHEARSEPRKGQEAVAAVTINRVASPAFPDSVCQVVQQGGKKRNRCQFSWWCDRNSDTPREPSAWEHALSLSRKALDGKVSDPTNGALYYHASYVKPRWARTFTRTNKIGRHLFYKPRGA
jgi:spore germination cell wall hydrolase CwlJ-like protein